MSQIIKNLASGPVPPAVPTSFTTDVNSPAVPLANVLIEIGGFVSTNNANGIRTDGSSGSNTLTIQLTNRFQGSATTVGAGTADVITFTPTVIGTYSIEYRTAAYNVTSSLGGGYSFFGGIRFDGVNSNICDTFDEINNEEGTMSNTDLSVVVSGANVILRATGYLGQTINWSSVGLYTFVGV
jgi:hypothetical protein